MKLSFGTMPFRVFSVVFFCILAFSFIACTGSEPVDKEAKSSLEPIGGADVGKEEAKKTVEKVETKDAGVIDSGHDTHLVKDSQPEKSVDSGKNTTEKKSVKEAVKEAAKEAVKEAVKEAAKEAVKETIKDSAPAPQIVGKACSSSTSCGKKPAYCLKEGAEKVFTERTFPFPETTGRGPTKGYCTTPCGAGDKCPSGSVCYVAPMTSKKTCLKTCTQVSDCRGTDGYLCKKPKGLAQSVCIPPVCNLKEAKLLYLVVLSNARPVGTCSGGNPVKEGRLTSLNLKVKSSGQIIFNFNRKPSVSVVFTWRLKGTHTIPTTSKAKAALPTGCTSNCQGQIEATFLSKCYFFGTLLVKQKSCTYKYDYVAYKS